MTLHTWHKDLRVVQMRTHTVSSLIIHVMWLPRRYCVWLQDVSFSCLLLLSRSFFWWYQKHRPVYLRETSKLHEDSDLKLADFGLAVYVRQGQRYSLLGCFPTKIDQMGADKLLGSFYSVNWSLVQPSDDLQETFWPTSAGHLPSCRWALSLNSSLSFFGVQIEQWCNISSQGAGMVLEVYSRAVHFLKVECPKIDGVISCGFILTRQKRWVRHKLI